ncbi:MAG: polymerase sigma factor for flagellar operon [Myxococcaceae bacterium]|nr:polymerase sigma factor for flagellar operon [Myxococcaceae bacterium]
MLKDAGAGALGAYAMQRPSRDELIQRGLPIVRRLAFRLARRLPPNVDVGDLIGAGTEGLLKAIEAYDVSNAARFETYAEARVRGAILDELRGQDALTRHGRRQMSEVTRVMRRLEAELGRAPEEQEVAAGLGIELEAYHKLAENLSRAPALANLGALDPDDVAGGHDSAGEFESRELKTRLMGAIKRLPERTQTVLGLYYQEECTLAEIGEVLGVTESRVCQILGDATVRLRAALGK